MSECRSRYSRFRRWILQEPQWSRTLETMALLFILILLIKVVAR